jgi:hypothetical protein
MYLPKNIQLLIKAAFIAFIALSDYQKVIINFQINIGVVRLNILSFCHKQ